MFVMKVAWIILLKKDGFWNKICVFKIMLLHFLGNFILIFTFIIQVHVCFCRIEKSFFYIEIWSKNELKMDMFKYAECKDPSKHLCTLFSFGCYVFELMKNLQICYYWQFVVHSTLDKCMVHSPKLNVS